MLSELASADNRLGDDVHVHHLMAGVESLLDLSGDFLELSACHKIENLLSY